MNGFADEDGARMDRPRLSRRQAECLAAIERLTEAKKYPPSFKELMGVMGIKSPNGIACHVRALINKGYLRRGAYGQARTWILVPDQEVVTATDGLT